MRLLETARGLLERANYRTTTAGGVGEGQFIFENANLYGLTAVLPPAAILERWEVIQDTFLRQQGPRLQRVPEKAWNVYVVFLSDLPCAEPERARLRLIEEDFRGSRKLARCGLQARDAVETALAPLLPLRFARPLTSIDVEGRIRNDPAIDSEVRDLLLSGQDQDTIIDELLRK